MKIERNLAGYIKKWSVGKRCPFCGEKAEIDEFTEAEAYEPGYYYQGEMLSCQCGVNIKVYKHSYETEDIAYYDIETNYEIKEKMRKDLLKKWNTRYNFNNQPT